MDAPRLSFALVGLTIWLVLGLAILVISFVPGLRILRKAGYSGWWAFLWVVPLVDIVMIWLFAIEVGVVNCS